MGDIKSIGLVGEIAKHIYGRVQANPAYTETCAAALVSTAMGRNVVVSTEIGDLYPNVFGLIVGASALTKKSVTNDIVKDMVRGLSEKVKIDLLLPEKFSVPKMTNILVEQKEGIIVGDEYTRMFQDCTGPHYLDMSMEFLSKLYDGEVPKYATIKRGVEYARNVHVNFLSATTYYLCKMMRSDDFFVQGTGCRILWDVHTEISDELSFSDASKLLLGEAERQRRDKEVEALVDRLYEIRRTVETFAATSLNGVIGLTFDEIDTIATMMKFLQKKYAEAAKRFRENKLDPDVGYLGRMAENALKLAAIHCIGRWESGSPQVPDIDKQDTTWAINKVVYHYEQYKKLLEIRDNLITDVATKGHKTDFQKVLTIIDRKGGYATITNIMQGTGWLKSDAEPILMSMVLSKMLKVARRVGRGPHSFVYLRPETDLQKFSELVEPKEYMKEMERRAGRSK